MLQGSADRRCTAIAQVLSLQRQKFAYLSQFRQAQQGCTDAVALATTAIRQPEAIGRQRLIKGSIDLASSPALAGGAIEAVGQMLGYQLAALQIVRIAQQVPQHGEHPRKELAIGQTRQAAAGTHATLRPGRRLDRRQR